jgi:hypothetical protein
VVGALGFAAMCEASAWLPNGASASSSSIDSVSPTEAGRCAISIRSPEIASASAADSERSSSRMLSGQSCA